MQWRLEWLGADWPQKINGINLKNYLKKGTVPIDIAIALVAIASWLSISYPTYILIITCAAGFITVAGCGVTIFLSKNNLEEKTEIIAWSDLQEESAKSSEALNSYMAEMLRTPIIDSGSYWTVLKAIENGSVYGFPSTPKSTVDDFHVVMLSLSNKIEVAESDVIIPYEYKSPQRDRVFENDEWMDNVKLAH